MQRSRSTTAMPMTCAGSCAPANRTRRAHVLADPAKVAYAAMKIHDGRPPVEHAVLQDARAQATLWASRFAAVALQAGGAKMRLVLCAGRAQKPSILTFKRVRHAADRKHASHRPGADQHPATRDARLIAHKPILSRLTAAPPRPLSAACPDANRAKRSQPDRASASTSTTFRRPSGETRYAACLSARSCSASSSSAITSVSMCTNPRVTFATPR